MQAQNKLFFVIVFVACMVGFYLVAQQDAASRSDAALLKDTKYQPAVIPKDMTVAEKKQRFKKIMLPIINQVYTDLNDQYQQVSQWLEQGKKPKKIAELKEEYRATTDTELLAALKPHPPSIALAQAAIESAWGTSRFFVEAKNVFGIWSFDSDEPRIAASEQRGEKTIWLKKYNSLYDSVMDNYRVLARGDGYDAFRLARLKTDNPYELVVLLDQYSEKREVYTSSLISMISFNRFSEYDPNFYQKPKVVSVKKITSKAESKSEPTQVATDSVGSDVSMDEKTNKI